jgi:hypothetical protein
MIAISHIARSLNLLIKAAMLMPAAMLVNCSNADEVAKRTAAEDARAIVAVEAAQKRVPPVDFVTLQPISDSGDQPCSFNFPASVKPPVFRFGPDAGKVVIDGNAKGFAADHGSIEVYPGVRQQYDGKEFSLQIQLDTDDPANRGDPHHWPAKLTMSDRFERPVFYGVGLVTCGAQVIRSNTDIPPAPVPNHSR